MRTSLKKLRGLALHRHGDGRGDRRDRRLQQSMAQLDDLSRASQDMLDMRDCYDSLLSAAAATANSAYEFSESLREMGACLLEKTALNDDEESGKVLIMLGKVQFELQRLVDNYRSHIVKTITSPESLLNELRIVEEMKSQCDERRSVYEYMITKQREKGRSRSSKGETFSPRELQAAHDDFDEEATLFVFRMKSLKQGQSRSLLTQAARHHAAQLCFFRKALKSLETVEPHVKLVTEEQHIDYQFSGLEDDDGDDADSDDSDYDDDDDDTEDGNHSGHGDGELSFDYGENDQGKNLVSTPRDSMELDQVDITFPQVATVNAAKENLDRNPGGDVFPFGRDVKTSSQSAPLTAEKKFDPAEQIRQMRPITRKIHSYVLPTPVEHQSPVSTGPDTQASRTKRTSLSGASLNYRHSSPLEQGKYENIFRNEKLSGPIVQSQPSVLGESNNNNTTSTSIPPPLTEELSSQQHDQYTTSDTKKIKRQAFSGPLTGKSWSNKPGLLPGLSASNPIGGTGPPKLFSGPLLRTPVTRPTSDPKLSSGASPTLLSSPKISELHELPRPPTNLASKSSGRPSNQIGYSGPLVSKRQEIPAANKLVSSVASPLPIPPLMVPRSFSIPSSGQRVSMSMPLGVPQTLKIAEDIASPPLKPISLLNIQPASTS
ncbi:Uncharacterized protein LOK49_LG10G00074 [Camellia lanceoleosa]|uniref:Uncharacterized protein n=1 Tax=Camellia lanceoleosa TaxID=1840588 RepID=A0ACC0GCD9_9ERIC|nr:Uncharacterized protein LOK49_LG10G00074 [Camellia lanceoleosa]